MSSFQAGDMVQVKCKLAAGMFSHERTYIIAAPDGGEYRGAVQIHFCDDDQGRPIPDRHPAGEIAGSVEAMVVSASSARITVAIPGDENIDISPSLATSITKVRRVPVRT